MIAAFSKTLYNRDSYGQRQSLPDRPSTDTGSKTPTFFSQQCSACGRRLQIPVEQMGREVVCPHCNCRLIASGSHLSHDKTYSPVDRSDQALTRRSSGDEALWRRVMQFLHTRGIRNLAGVHVEVHQGIVVLQGSVGSPHDRWLCITCARRVAGVLNVVDELKVDRRDASFMRRAR